MPRKRILKIVMRALPPQFEVNKGGVYCRTYRHIVRGIFLDGSSSKATKYLLDFTFPLFRTESFVHISYSPRLRLNGKREGDGDNFSGTDEEIAAKVLRAVECAGLVGDALAGCSPEKFIERHAPDEIGVAQPFRAFDVACAAALAGDSTLARQAFVAARDGTYSDAARYGPYKDQDAFLADVEAARQALEAGGDAFQAHMDRASHAAASALGFCPPTIPPGLAVAGSQPGETIA